MLAKGSNDFFFKFQSVNRLVQGVSVQKWAKNAFYGNYPQLKVVGPRDLGLSANDHFLIGLQLIKLDHGAILTFSPLKNGPKLVYFSFFSKIEIFGLNRISGTKWAPNS